MPRRTMMKNPPPVLAYIIAALLVYSGWLVQGWRKDATIANLQKVTAQAGQKAAQDLAAANARNRQAESDGAKLIANITAQLRKETTDAKKDRDRFIADVRSGRIRLSIPIVNTNGTSNPSTDTSTDSGRGNETRAELAPAAASALDAIAGDGDDAIRQLNACIDSYNGIRERFNVQAQ